MRQKGVFLTVLGTGFTYINSGLSLCKSGVDGLYNGSQTCTIYCKETLFGSTYTYIDQ